MDKAESNIRYSIIVPVFNSAGTIPELFERTSRVMDEYKAPFEFIFIDDNSSDNSWSVLKKLKEDSPDRVTAIRLSKNFGQHNATFCGFNFAKGENLITIDDDLQTPPEEISSLIRTLEEENRDMVYGIYHIKKHSLTRNLASKLLKRSSSWLGRPGEGSSFRIIRRDVIDKVLVHHQNFIFIDEILHWYTDNVGFVMVRHEKRRVNKSGYNVRKLWGLMSNLLIYYTTIPLKIMVYGGLISSAFFFVLSIIFAINRFIFDVPLGYTSLIVTILFSTSLILFCLGIIGEYLSRIYMVQNKKPPYSISRVL
jgi:glycosyltransferase involved in cell wall biosynthesis